MRDVILSLQLFSFAQLPHCAGRILGCSVFIWLGFFNPQSMTWGSTPHSLIMAFATIAGYFFSSEPKRFPFQRESILLLLLWIVFGMTTAFAIYPDQGELKH